MTEPAFRYVPVMDHELHVTCWGAPENPAIVMWHGLARTGRDFDELARALSDQYFVLCPDTIGRGRSSWSRDPMAEYTVEYYAGIAGDMLDHFGIDRAGWIGTSMGGLIAMRIASGPAAHRLSWLILNDVGPEIPAEGLQRILQYATRQPVFDDHGAAEDWLRNTYATFGENSDIFWSRMLRTSLRRQDDGRLTLHYDPAVMTALMQPPDDPLSPWDRWDRITLPTHLIFGAQSDIMPAELAQRMAQRGPKPQLSMENHVGHAPTLATDAQIQLVREIVERLSASG